MLTSEQRVNIGNNVSSWMKTLQHELIHNEADPDAVKYFWKMVKREAELNLPQQIPEDEREMNYEQARWFGQEVIEWGNFKGQKVKDVPLGYLLWVIDPNPFKKKLFQYVKFKLANQGLNV